MRGGEIFVPKIPSMKVTNLISVIAPDCKVKVIGIRPGEKLHETLITIDEARHTREFENYFVIHPEFKFWTTDSFLDMTGRVLSDSFSYTSDTNKEWLSTEHLRRMIGNI